MIDRTERILAAVAKRISRQGDMAIRVHRNTMNAILRRCGLSWDLGCDDFREVDALALDALRFIAWRSIPLPDAKRIDDKVVKDG